MYLMLFSDTLYGLPAKHIRGVRVMAFNNTFNNISAILGRSDLLVEET
jgi:hypothetical protein